MTSKVPTDSHKITHEKHVPKYITNTKPRSIPGTIHNLFKKKSLRK